MIVPEIILRDIFTQLPPVIDNNSVPYTVKFHWGNQDDLNLYLSRSTPPHYPLIWLVQDRNKVTSTELTRRVKLMIAKSSEHKTSMNPTVWETEFEEVLNPLLDKVVKCLKQSGRTFIVNNEWDEYREANYSEFERTVGGKTESKTKTIDIWNVITFEAEIRFTESTMCIQEINFN